MADVSKPASNKEGSIPASSEKAKVLAYLTAGNEEYLNIYPCDVLLTVEEHEFPVHGTILACHSRVFSEMLNALNDNPESKLDGKWSMKLTDAVEDVELMLSILYGSRVSLDTALEAARMMFIGDKYDIPKIFRLSEPTLCNHDHQMHFIETTYGAKDQRSTVEWLDAVPLLSIAGRVGLEKLRFHCQYVILRDTIESIQKSGSLNCSGLLSSMRSLEGSGVNPRDIHELVVCLIHASSAGVALLKQKECSKCNRVVQGACFQAHCANCRTVTSCRETRPSSWQTRSALFAELSKIHEGRKKA